MSALAPSRCSPGLWRSLSARARDNIAVPECVRHMHVDRVCARIVSRVHQRRNGQFTGGIFAFYLVATAWATAERGENEPRKLDWIAPPIALAFGVINFVWGVKVARGQTAVKNQSSVGAYVFFGALALMCTAGDVRMLLRGGLSGTQRLVRHLWRMCFGWFIATISFFLGQQRVFPAWLRGSYVLVVLAFLPLIFLIFWFVRVRLTNTYLRARAASAR